MYVPSCIRSIEHQFLQSFSFNIEHLQLLTVHTCTCTFVGLFYIRTCTYTCAFTSCNYISHFCLQVSFSAAQNSLTSHQRRLGKGSLVLLCPLFCGDSLWVVPNGCMYIVSRCTLLVDVQWIFSWLHIQIYRAYTIALIPGNQFLQNSISCIGMEMRKYRNKEEMKEHKKTTLHLLCNFADIG